MNKNKIWIILIIILVVLLVGEFIFLYFTITKNKPIDEPIDVDKPVITDEKTDQPKEIEKVEFAKFESESEFNEYYANAEANYHSYFSMAPVMATREPMMIEESIDTSANFGLDEVGATTGLGSAEKTAPQIDRVSETNVQVVGIDEPDIIKTNGTEIFYSSWFNSPRPIEAPVMEPMDDDIEEDIMIKEISIAPPSYQKSNLTKIIKAMPVDEMELYSDLEGQGQLLFSDDILLIYEYDKITAYNVSDPENPTKAWDMKYQDRNSLAGTRLYGDKIYLITQTYVNEYTPCPIEPVLINGTAVRVGCADIYRPNVVFPVDSTFTIFVINPKTGEIEKQNSVVGSTANSVIYMSKDNIYISYYYPVNMVKVLLDFMTEEAASLFPNDVIAKINKLKGYDISDQAKMTEAETIMEKYFASLSRDEEMMIENELENKMETYFAKKAREIDETQIVKLSVSDLQIKANGSVPGSLLNQFSLDEYQNNLRIATTIGGNMFWGNSDTKNDVYVLDDNLDQVGSVLDLGVTERIYSVRFIEDKGYVVTFRRIDPFYVLDLSLPSNPEMKGELKIPGYSSYLHPLAENMILGIGEEDNQVKLSIFDVSDPSNPTEKAKYQLKEYWSDIANTHHAFLQDEKYKIFFLPGSKGGYVFSYENNELSLKKTVSDYRVKRAIFINDYLYIVGDNKITVFDEKNWNKIKEFEL